MPWLKGVAVAWLLAWHATVNGGEGVWITDAGGHAGEVRIRGPVTLSAGESLVLAPQRAYDGAVLDRSRPVRVILETESNASLTVERGAVLRVEGTEANPVRWETDPADPAVKPVVLVRNGAKATLMEAEFINVALRIEGRGARLRKVSVQYAGDQPAFAFVGAQGVFEYLFAHHATWGFSFEPLQGVPCDLTLYRPLIRSCARGSRSAFYEAGGGLRGVQATRGKHRVRLVEADWDPSWDALQGVELTETAPGRPRVVCIGDSIVQGSAGYVNFWNYFKGNDPFDHSWPHLLQEQVPHVYVMNKGEGGDRTTGMLRRLDDVTRVIRPRVTLVGGGTNDLRNEQVRPEDVVDRLATIWSRLRDADILPVQLAITPCAAPFVHDDRIVETNHLLEKAAQEADVPFVDLYALLAGENGRGLHPDYDGDGIHPNRIAYGLIADRLAPVLRAMDL